MQFSTYALLFYANSLFLKKLNYMIKSKLRLLREQKYTQEEFAQLLKMETSNYNRRENGVTKISKREWDKMAKLLECNLKEIYEPEDGVYVINGDYTQGNFGNGGTFNANDDFILGTLKKYIAKLEDENILLKEQNQIKKDIVNNLEKENMSLKIQLKKVIFLHE